MLKLTRPLALLSIVGAASLGIGACGGDDDGLTPGSVPASAVAVVADQAISKEAFERRLLARARGVSPLAGGGQTGLVLDPPRFRRCAASLFRQNDQLRKQAGAPDSATAPSRAQLRESCKLQYEHAQRATVSELVQDQWYVQAAAEAGFDPSPAEIEQRLDQFAASFGGGPPSRAKRRFAAALKRSGLDRDDLRSQLLGQLARQAWQAQQPAPGEVGDDEVERFYDENPALFGTPATRVVEVVAVADEDTAKAARDRVDDGESVADVSLELSTDGNVKAGDGVMSVQKGVAGTMPEGFVDAVFEADEDSVTGPVEVDGTWYVFSVSSASESDVPPLAKIKRKVHDLAVSNASQRARVEAENEFREEWRQRSLCGEDYLVQECANGPEMTPVPLP